MLEKGVIGYDGRDPIRSQQLEQDWRVLFGKLAIKVTAAYIADGDILTEPYLQEAMQIIHAAYETPEFVIRSDDAIP